jgi:hypothetical protein
MARIAIEDRDMIAEEKIVNQRANDPFGAENSIS